MVVGNLSKSGPSDGNYNIPNLLAMSDTVVHCFESIPLGQMHGLVGTMNDCLVENSSTCSVPTGKNCICSRPNKVIVAAADKNAVAAVVRSAHPVSPADKQCYPHLEIVVRFEKSQSTPFPLCAGVL